MEKLNRAGVPAGPVYSMDQVFADPQVRQLGLAWSVEHALLGTLQLVRSPIQMPGIEPPRQPTPERGEHTDAVLGDFGFSAEEVAALRAKRAL